jgi:hypothetical protein
MPLTVRMGDSNSGTSRLRGGVFFFDRDGAFFFDRGEVRLLMSPGLSSGRAIDLPVASLPTLLGHAHVSLVITGTDPDIKRAGSE